MANQLVERGYLTQSLGSASHSGEHGFKAVPGLLKLVLENQAWKERIIVETGEEFEGFTTFEAYVKTNPPKGLGSDIDTIRRLVSNDIKTLDALNQAIGSHQGQRTDLEDNFHNIVMEVKKKQGNDKAYALRKLQKDRPDLHAQVLACEISPHKAMVEAGFRRPTISIDPSSPQSARTLIEKASPEFLAELRRLLSN